jgi:hypothetical protein
MKRHLLIAFALLHVACDDGGSSVDAPPGAADAPPGAADARSDAQVSVPDAPVSGVDAGPGVTIQMACERACARVAECFMEEPAPCETDCTDDLADCTQAEIENVYDCGGVACGELKNCIGSNACVTG